METAGSLAGLTFDRAFSSPLKRAFETAQILLAGRNVPLETDERLMEMGFGDCEGGAFEATGRKTRVNSSPSASRIPPAITKAV